MSKERDERPLAEIRFGQDGRGSALAIEAAIRGYFEQVGVKVGQDIIDLGCTGLVSKLRETGTLAIAITLNTAQYIRRNMSGSICGLPCYVPRDRFCLVHDTIGGLQAAGNMDGPQAPRHSEALPLMSRELTEDERRTVAGINAKLAADAKEKALADYGAEEIEEPSDTAPAPSCPIPQPPFKCPNHEEPDWDCRKCIAQAIVEGPMPMLLEFRALSSTDSPLSPLLRFPSIADALCALKEDRCKHVALWVQVAAWSKKVARD